MKTTVQISDQLLIRARRKAKQEGRTLRALIEEGLRLALESDENHVKDFLLPDRGVGDPNGPNPLESMSWADLRDEIYGGR